MHLKQGAVNKILSRCFYKKAVTGIPLPGRSEDAMLYLNRKPGEAVIINQTIEVRVVEVRGRTVKLGFTFPAEASVLREEIFEAVKAANEAAVDAVRALPETLAGRRPASGD